MISGIDNVIYSNVRPDRLSELFLKKMLNIWDSPLIERTKEEEGFYEDYFIAKDEKMLLWQDENGYTVNGEGESCVYLICSGLNGIDYGITVDNEIRPITGFMKRGPYESRVVFSNISMYTLVTPGIINECKFSTTVYNYLIDCLYSLSNID